MSGNTVKITKIPTAVSVRDITKLFRDIESVEIRKDNKWFQTAYVTFKDSEAAAAALFLSGATISMESDYKLPTAAYKPPAASLNDEMLAVGQTYISATQDLIAMTLDVQEKVKMLNETVHKESKKMQAGSGLPIPSAPSEPGALTLPKRKRRWGGEN